MILSRNWLNELLDLNDITNEKLKELISQKMIEIETSYPFVNATNLTIGEVLECDEHPNSDHLHICKVDVKEEILQIVCGASNVEKGKKVIVAKIGAILPGDFKIKPSKIRGVESFGMLCSLQELGIEEKYIEDEFKNGIYLLDDSAKVGENPLDFLGFNDYLFELGLTPNRSDLLSYYGAAYDIAAITKKSFKYEYPTLNETSKKNPMDVKIMTDKCLKYSTRVIEDVKIEKSPEWLKSKLIKNGIRPINNVVDITNYVLLELGQPLHAFDYDLFKSDLVLVRLANEKEKTFTLDGIERVLSSEDIVITNGKEIKALGGVMGGLDSRVNENTNKIILEAAYFNPTSIRKTSKKLNLRSDSSIRFERKIDPNRIDMALDLACKMIVEISGGKVLKGIVTADYLNKEEKKINHKISEINGTLGTNLSAKEITEILEQLNFKYQNKADDLVITVPTRRVDIETIQDINEEIARIFGYNNIPTTMPYTNQEGSFTEKQRKIRLIRNLLTDLGLNEVVTYSLVSKENINKYALNKEEGKEIKILYPLSEKREYMREDLIYSLLEVLDYNKARQGKNVKIFEIGKLYSKENESLKLGFVLEGEYANTSWQGKKEKIDFYVAKGILNQVFNRLGVLNDITYLPYDLENPVYFKQKTAKIYYKDQLIGVLGSLDLRMKEYQDTIVLEISLDKIIETEEGKEEILYKPLNKFPKIERDLAIIIDKDVSAGELIKAIKEAGGKVLTDLKIFDLFIDEKLGENKKSIALTLTFEDYEKTLESETVDNKIGQILKKINQKYNAYLRA